MYEHKSVKSNLLILRLIDRHTFSLFTIYMIKTKVTFLESQLLSNQSKQFKGIQRALIGWKKAGRRTTQRTQSFVDTKVHTSLSFKHDL